MKVFGLRPVDVNVIFTILISGNKCCVYLLRALKALGLVNLISYSSVVIMGDRGSMSVDTIISGGSRYGILVFWMYHFIFRLFVDGNSVSDVE